MRLSGMGKKICLDRAKLSFFLILQSLSEVLGCQNSVAVRSAGVFSIWLALSILSFLTSASILGRF